MQSRESFSNEAAKTKPVFERNDSQREQLGGNFHSDSDYDGEKPFRESRSRRNREWKGLVMDATDPPPLQSSEIESFHSEKAHRRSGLVSRARSPRPAAHRKRKLQNEQQPTKVRACGLLFSFIDEMNALLISLEWNYWQFLIFCVNCLY